MMMIMMMMIMMIMMIMIMMMLGQEILERSTSLMEKVLTLYFLTFLI